MSRPLRFDHPGALHHVTNRGHGHARVFETSADVNCFTSLLAEAAARQQVEIHAYAILSTHVHLLVRSVAGDLAAEMQRVFGLYAIWFNRTRGRDGHVFKGRYHSVPILGQVQLALTVTYSDFNPVAAGMAPTPEAYPHSSAHHYLSPRPPPWLTTDLVRALACRIAGTRDFQPDTYTALWRACHGQSLSGLIDRTLQGRRLPLAPLDVLGRAGPEDVQRWLAENTLREEGRSAPVLALPEAVLRRVLDESPRLPVDACRGAGASPRRMERAFAAGLLHALSGLSMDALAASFSVSRATACVEVVLHNRALRQNSAYAARAAAVVSAALHDAYGALLTAGV